MEIADVLQWDDIGDLPAPLASALRRPIMVVTLTGWFDAAGVATSALAHLVEHQSTRPLALIDPDPFYDFTQTRPEARLDDGGERTIAWPCNEITLVRNPDGLRDLVVLSGVEPHVRWRTYIECLIEVYERTGCEALVTIGASADTVPHTRVPTVVGSSVDPTLARTLGLARPTYQGITGVIGVLQAEFEKRSLPAVSLRVGVPHYLANAQHPQSSAALLRHLEHVLGVPTRHALLDEEIERWRSLHDDAVSEDDRALNYVRMLELEFDRKAEAAIPSGDDLAAEFQRFLDENRPDEPPA